MKVSVIVPVYNVEQYLARCLDSILAQTYDDYEIICVNDCSPDNSSTILSEYVSKHSDRIKVITNEVNLGLGLSREKALGVACGEFVMFIDSDDYIKPDYLQHYLDATKDGDYDIVVGGYIRDIDGKLTEHYLSDTVWSSTTYAIACAKLYRRSFISENDLHFTSIKCGEDIYFSLSAFYCNAKTKVIQYAGYYYVLNPDSITGSMNYKKNHERIMAELFDTFLKNHELSSIPQDRQDVIEYTYLANMIDALISFNHGCGISLMKEKYAFAKADAESKFPNYLSNQYVGLLKPKGQRTKIRLGVGVVILLEKIHMARFLFYLIALI